MSRDYSKIQEMLERQETFPHRFVYKFVGQNTPAFAASCQALERTHPGLQLQSSRESANGGHLAKTYVFEAPDAAAIIAIYREIEHVEDVLVVL